MNFFTWILELLFGKMDVIENLKPLEPQLKTITKIPAYGEKGSNNVKVLQQALKEKGHFKGEVLGNFLDITRDALISFQRAQGWVGTGVIGELTLKALGIVLKAPEVTTSDESIVLDTLKRQAPHVFEAIKMLGWTEFSHDKELTALCWPNTTDCKHLKTVIGKSNAYCSGFWCGVNARLGLPSTRSGGADSWQRWGDSCGYVFGAFLPLRHKSGGHHITTFLWWIDKDKKIAACLGGNQSNSVSIAAYNLSGNANGHDEVVSGPRFFKGMTPPSGPYKPTGWKVGTAIGGSTT